jgi:hypothetical protein
MGKIANMCKNSTQNTDVWAPTLANAMQSQPKRQSVIGYRHVVQK